MVLLPVTGDSEGRLQPWSQYFGNLLFQYKFGSPQVKRDLISNTADFLQELPKELPNARLKTYELRK